MIQFHQRVGPDGVLKLAVPLSPGDANKDVVVTIEALGSTFDVCQELEWNDFLDATYGSCADLDVKRGPQGGFESREKLD